MPFFDVSQIQRAWDAVFPAIAGPVGAALDGITGSIQAP